MQASLVTSENLVSYAILFVIIQTGTFHLTTSAVSRLHWQLKSLRRFLFFFSRNTRYSRANKMLFCTIRFPSEHEELVGIDSASVSSDLTIEGLAEK